MEMKEIMNEEEVAALLGVHLRTLQRQRVAHGLPFQHIRIGDRVLYSRQAVLAAFSVASTKKPEPAITQKRGPGRPRKNHF